MPQRRPPGLRSRPRIELLEDRSVPAVLASQDGNGLVTVTLNAANDAATITGTGSGAALDVAGTGLATQSFTGVTGIQVVDGGTNAAQTVTFDDDGSGTLIAVSNAVGVANIETVNIATANGALQANSVAVSGASTIHLDANVTTSGSNGQNYDGPVIVGKTTVTLNAGASGGVTFPQTVNGASAGGNALVVNAGGTTTFTGMVGNSAALASLATDAPGIVNIGANVVTTGGQTYNDPAVLPGDSISVTSKSAGTIAFNNTLNGSNTGAHSLTVNTEGATVFGGAVGGTNPLGSLATDAPGTVQIKANITSIGALTFNDPATLFGNAITLATTVGANIAFNGTVDGSVAGETALTVTSSTGVTSFAGDVGAAVALASIATSAGTGVTRFGSGSGVNRTVTTTGSQVYNDPVQLNAASVAFSSTSNSAISFKDTLNSNPGLSATAVVNTGGVTTFGANVGGITPLNALSTNNAGQTGEQTVVQASITTSNDITLNDTVAFTPGTSVLSQLVNSTLGDITLNGFGSESAVPVTIKAAADITLGGNAAFTAVGSRLNVQAGATGAGAYHIGSGLTFRADVQTWQAGEGSGAAQTAQADLVTNAPAFRDAGGTNAPKTFVLRQDGNVTDATIPAKAQFGTAPPANYTIISDDGTLTLNTTTDLAGPGTANLTLSSNQTLTLGTSITAPAGIVRLRSASANIVQTGSSAIAASGLGTRSGTSTALTGANLITGTFAATATTSNIQMANGSPYSIGTIGADPLGLAFVSVTGVGTAAGNVTFSQTGASALDITVSAFLSGASVTANGGPANDKLTVNYAFGATLSSGLVFNGNGGTDSLILTDAGGAAVHNYTIGGTVVRDSASAISYSGVETVSVTGGTGADTFNVTPDTTAAITVTGGNPTGTTGDKLSLTLTGATNPSLNATKQADGFTGTATFGNKASVSFSQVESVAPQTDIQVTAVAAPQRIPANGTSTITVVVKNNGPDASTNSAFDQTFPANATFAWTAVASSGSSVTDASGTGDIHTTMNLAVNGTVTFTITVTPAANFLGSLPTTATATAGSAAFDSDSTNNSATATVIVEPTSLLAVGAGAGAGPQVRVFNSDGTQRFSFFAYAPSFTGGVTVATGDVTGDGVEDIVTGAATTASHVKVFDGATGAEIRSFFAFPGFTGGVNVAIAGGDVIVGAGIGGGPVFAGYDLSGGGLAQTFSLYAFDPSFRGGVQVAGSADHITVGAGPGGAPHIKVFDSDTRELVSSFYALPTNNAGGVNLAMGKAGAADTVIVGAGIGMTPNVVTVEAATGRIIGSALAFNSSFTGGVRVASVTTPAGQGGVAFAAGPGGAPRVRVLGPTGSAALDFYAFDASFSGGVYVG